MPVQLSLDLGDSFLSPGQRWQLLPECTRHQVVLLLARLIAKGVVEEAGSDE